MAVRMPMSVVTLMQWGRAPDWGIEGPVPTAPSALFSFQCFQQFRESASARKRFPNQIKAAGSGTVLGQPNDASKLRVSYFSDTACHLDLSQWATDPTWNGLSHSA